MIDRRTFLKSLAAVTAGLSIKGCNWPLRKETDSIGPLLPLRPLGKTGAAVTMLGLGGHHIGGEMSERDAQATIEVAMEGGVRFFDTAEGYQDGESEKRYGKYLSPKYREQVFLMTKCEQKTMNDAMESLDKSLKRLNTDYLDLWQVHTLNTDYLDLWQVHTLESVDDVDERVAGGIIDAMTKAKESGKVRHIGFTGHATPATHMRMLEHTKAFETSQMPINVCDPSYKSFILNVLPVLLKRKMGVLAMKTLGEGSFTGRGPVFEENDIKPIIPDQISIREALYFVWSLPVSVIITGPDNPEMMREKILLAQNFTKMNEDQRQALIDRVADIASQGLLEDYKYGEFA
ncbi:MAG: aldo/keto reductase [Planctomycetota bacterium]|jgi:aryl-alcohol dehydrogenase-like predicted oxidoreductase